MLQSSAELLQSIEQVVGQMGEICPQRGWTPINGPALKFLFSIGDGREHSEFILEGRWMIPEELDQDHDLLTTFRLVIQRVNRRASDVITQQIPTRLLTLETFAGLFGELVELAALMAVGKPSSDWNSNRAPSIEMAWQIDPHRAGVTISDVTLAYQMDPERLGDGIIELSVEGETDLVAAHEALISLVRRHYEECSSRTVA